MTATPEELKAVQTTLKVVKDPDVLRRIKLAHGYRHALVSQGASLMRCVHCNAVGILYRPADSTFFSRCPKAP